MVLIARLIALFGASMLVMYLSMDFSAETEKVAAIWPLNAIVLGLLARQPRQHWRLILVTVLTASATTSILRGVPAQLAIGFALANLVEILFCARFLLTASGAVHLDHSPSLFRFFVVAAIGGPACSAIVAALVLVDSRELSDTWLVWFVSDSLGMLVFAPALLVFGSASDSLYRQSSAAQKLIAALGVTTVLVVVFAQHSYPLLFCIAPALTLATFRLGMRGAALGILITALIAIVATTSGSGPIFLAVGDDSSRFYLLQFFLGVVSLTTLPIAAALENSGAVLADSRTANAELEAARAAAESSRAEAIDYAKRYRDLAEYATDIVLRLGPGGVISYASPAIHILGLLPEDVVDQKLADLFLVEDRVSAAAAIDELFEDTHVHSGPRHEFRARTHDGSVIWLEGNPTIIREPSGAPVEVVSLYRDVTARRAMAVALEQARVSAEQAAAAKSDFLANMSHELRTPLNSVVGYSQLLREVPQIDPRHERYVDIIASSSLGLLALVNDVLDYSSLEAGALKLVERPFSFRRLATQVVESFQIAAEAKGIALLLTIDDTLAERHLGDEARLRQVLLNLLNNAVKFTDSGTVTLRATAAESVADRQTLVIAVVDTGVGIAQDQVPKLYGRFERLDHPHSRHHGGTGLGLAIVKQLVELMGGAVSVETQLGKGSCFEVSLRLAIQPVIDCEPTHSDAGLLKIRELRLLVVDDIDINRELVLALLAGTGHHIDVATDGAEALEMVQQFSFDLVLMDVRMPVMDGLSATRAIRRLPHLVNLPIVAMTAQALPEQIRDCQKAGMSDYLSKPITADALKEVINKWAGVREVPVEPDEQAVLDGLRDRFLIRCANELELIRNRASAESAEALGESIHRLAGSARLFGLAEIAEAATHLDRMLSQQKQPDDSEYEALISALQSTLDSPCSIAL